MSVLDLVKQRRDAKSRDIKLTKGYTHIQIMSRRLFWGVPSKLKLFRPA